MERVNEIAENEKWVKYTTGLFTLYTNGGRTEWDLFSAPSRCILYLTTLKRSLSSSRVTRGRTLASYGDEAYTRMLGDWDGTSY